ncbi:MAG: TlpA family protein disulfide reductase [Emticicia sp.]|uniref:TlpA family protein disulfide reductase n=1 Tax=Emticicia sp. TaxID=1930953 RepID=UPI003BA41F00
MKIFYFSLIITFLISCESKGTKVKKVENLVLTNFKKNKDLIVFKIELSQNNSAVLYYDSFGKYHLLSTGITNIETSQKKIQVVCQNRTIKQVFLCDTNKDTIKISEKKSFFFIKSKNLKDSIIDNLYLKYIQESKVKIVDNVPDVTIEENNLNENLKEREKKIEIDLESKNIFLESYKQKFELSEESISAWRDFFKYEMLEKKLYIIPNRKIMTILPKWYHEEIKNTFSNFNNDSKLYLRAYKNSVGLVYDYFTTKAPLQKAYNLQSEYDELDKIFTNQTRDLFLYKYISLVKNNPYRFKFTDQEYGEILNKYISSCKTPEFINSLTKKQNLDNLITKGNEVLDINNKQFVFDKLNQSPLTYIDFWASWCFPCLKEMSVSKKLKEEYREKGVNFLYISIDENPASWEKAMKQIGLLENESFILPKNTESEIAKKYKINSIPRYMIIDKDGKVINQDAPRPSDPKIRQIFDELLRK